MNITALANSPWFLALRPALQMALSDAMQSRTYHPGQFIHQAGDPPSGFYGVCEGRVRVSRNALSGREILLAILEPGSWFGEISSFDNKPRTHDAVAEGTVTLAVIAQARFDALLDTHPEFYREFITLLCSRVRGAFQFIDAGALLTQRQQLIRRLTMLMTSYGQQQDVSEPVTLQISQESMAHMINSSRQTVNRVLQELAKDGLVKIEYGRVRIPDPVALQQASQA